MHRSGRTDGSRSPCGQAGGSSSTPEHTHFAGRGQWIGGPRARPARPRIDVSMCDHEHDGALTHVVRFAAPNGSGFEGSMATMAAADHAVRQVASEHGDVAIRQTARLGEGGTSLPFIPASAVRPGMLMFDQQGGYDVVESVERVTLDRPVYDMDIAGTHNFVADGLVTHNSIYGFEERTSATSSISRTLSRRPRGQAGAELPFDADDPRCRQRGDPQQPGPEAEVAVDRDRRRGTRSRSASWRTSTPRRDTSPGRSSGWSTRGRREPRSRCSTGPTRSRGCWRTRWCGPRSPTR